MYMYIAYSTLYLHVATVLQCRLGVLRFYGLECTHNHIVVLKGRKEVLFIEVSSFQRVLIMGIPLYIGEIYYTCV